MIRVVVDPGVFVSALIGRSGSAPDLLVRALVDERIVVVVSPQLLDELHRVLRRPKFARYFDDRVRHEFVERIGRLAVIAQDPDEVPPASRDAGDDYLVALSRSERVDALVSGDRDLLDASLEAPPVWTPRQLADRVWTAG